MVIELRYAGTRHLLTPDDNRKRTLARLLWLEGPLPPRGLCMGIGQCGLCRVRFLSFPPEPTAAERRILASGELKNGIRLACRHLAADGMVLEVDDAPDGHVRETSSPNGIASSGPKKASKITLLSVDLGTTSVAWKVEDADGKPLDHGQGINPQMGAGSEVMARLAEADRPGGAARLQKIILDHIRHLVTVLEERGWRTVMIGLAGNPAMTNLALGLDISGLSASPYRLDYPGGLWEHLPGLPPLWTAPLISPFVGGDLSAGLALLLDASRPFLLADMGTNGEFLLRTEASLMAASVPLGPALEGVGMSLGGLAGPGAALTFRLSPAGLEAESPDKSPLERISGTGYLSLVRILLDTGVINEHGLFSSPESQGSRTSPSAGGSARPGLLTLGSRLAKNLTHSPAGALRLDLKTGRDLYLDAGDVENLLKVKAAFRLAVDCLLEKAGLAATDLNSIYLAGSLGRHAPVETLERLGFLPPGGGSRTRAVGNASLDGMALMLRHLCRAGANPDLPSSGREVPLIRRLLEVTRTVRVLNLTDDPEFHRRYVDAMRFDGEEHQPFLP